MCIRSSLFILAILFHFHSCKNVTVKNEKEYNVWINSKENGCILKKEIKNISYTAKYLPTSFLVMREKHISETILDTDSLQSVYEKGINIYFRIDPLNNDVDIMYADVYNEEQFHQRVYDMNFNLKEMFSLEYKGERIYPSLFHLENDYGMSKGRGMDIVFPITEKYNLNDEFTLIFDDEIFLTGINKFKFKIKDNPRVIFE